MPITNDMPPRGFVRHLGIEPQEPGAIPFREVSLGRDAKIDADTSIFIVFEGWVAGSKFRKEGGRQICALHIEGDYANLRRLALPKTDLQYRAVTTARIALLPIAAVAERCRASRDVAAAILRKIAVAGSISDEWIRNIGVRPALNRVAHLLCELAERLDRAYGKARTSYPLPLTQTEIGQTTGLSAVHVNRVIQGLRARGLLELRGGQMDILDRRQLVELAGFDADYLH